MPTYQVYGKTLVYTPDAARHRYKVNDEPKRGVTEILRVINKPALMLWPLNEAMKWLFDAKWDEKESKYIAAQGVPRLSNQQLLEGALAAYTVKSDKGKDVGSEVHGAVEVWLAGVVAGIEHWAKPPYALSDQAEKAFTAFANWFVELAPGIIATEQPVYSNLFDYCGTFDALLELDGKEVMVDFKTTNVSPSALRIGKNYTGIYPEHFLQLAAYASAWEEMGNKLPDELRVVNVTKAGKLHELSNMDIGCTVIELINIWNATLSLYKWQKRVKG